MGPYTYARLRRLIECEAQFLLADGERDTPEAAFSRAGHQVMEQFVRHPQDLGSKVLMVMLASRVLLASTEDTNALRRALIDLPEWYVVPAPATGESAVIEQPIHVVLKNGADKLGFRRVIGSRGALPEEISAGSSPDGWLFASTVEYGVFPGRDWNDGKPALVVDWKFDRALPTGDLYSRRMEARLHALAAWIKYGSMANEVIVQTVYPMFRVAQQQRFTRDDFLDIVYEVEGMLLRADHVLASGPATLKHARVGVRCELCPVSHLCPAVNVAVVAQSGDGEEWSGRAQDWILLRKRVQTLEASLREKALAEGPIKTVNGYEVGFRDNVFGVWRQRLGDDPLALIDPT